MTDAIPGYDPAVHFMDMNIRNWRVTLSFMYVLRERCNDEELASELDDLIFEMDDNIDEMREVRNGFP